MRQKNSKLPSFPLGGFHLIATLSEFEDVKSEALVKAELLKAKNSLSKTIETVFAALGNARPI